MQWRRDVHGRSPATRGNAEHTRAGSAHPRYGRDVVGCNPAPECAPKPRLYACLPCACCGGCCRDHAHTHASAVASWFADNAWCLKCNVFGASPCAADYMAFNVLLESNPSEAEEARIVTFFGEHGQSSTLASAAQVCAQRRLNGDVACVGAGSAISQCLRSDPDILSKKRLGAAERKAAEHVAGLRKKLGLPEPSSGLSTTELIGDIHRRLRIISGSVDSMLPPPWLRQVRVHTRLAVRVVRLTCRCWCVGARCRLQPQAAAAAPPSLSTKDSVSQLLGRLRELDADMTAIRDGLR